MKCYELIAKQIKKDITSLAIKTLNLKDSKEIFDACPSIRDLFNNIQLILKDASKDHEKLKEFEKEYENLDEIISFYFDPEEKEIIEDCKKSSKCSQRVVYFLFTNFPKTFGVDQRSAVIEKLRKMERIAAGLKGKLHTDQREFVDLMKKKSAGYAFTESIVAKYLFDLCAKLKTHKIIYETEISVQSTLIGLLKRKVMTEWFKKGDILDRTYHNSVTQIMTAFTKRGMDIPKVKSAIHKDVISEVASSVKCNIDFTKEIQLIFEDMIQIIQFFLKNMDQSVQTENSGLSFD